MFGNGNSKSLLTEELVDFGVTAFGGGWNYFHAVDSIREPDWNTSTKVMNDGCGMGSFVKFSLKDFNFKFSHILREVVVTVYSGVG